MPRLWTTTIEAHKREVSDAVLDTTAALVSERGLADLTMAEIAERSGIGRATLYKYFPSLEAVLGACHQRAVGRHLAELRALAIADEPPGDRLAAVVRGYAQRVRGGDHDPAVAAQLHAGEHTKRSKNELWQFLVEIIAEAAAAGEARRDVPPGELADYCISALAPSGRRSRPATDRIAVVVLDGLRPRDVDGP